MKIVLYYFFIRNNCKINKILMQVKKYQLCDNYTICKTKLVN